VKAFWAHFLLRKKRVYNRPGVFPDRAEVHENHPKVLLITLLFISLIFSYLSSFISSSIYIRASFIAGSVPPCGGIARPQGSPCNGGTLPAFR
jgi:hypothetical protein